MARKLRFEDDEKDQAQSQEQSDANTFAEGRYGDYENNMDLIGNTYFMSKFGDKRDGNIS